MIKRIIAAVDVFRTGSAVADAVKGKQRGAIAGALGVFIYAAASLAKEFGYDIGIDATVAQDIGVGLAAVAGLFVTYATSDKVGLLPAKPVPPVPQANVQADLDLRGD